MELARTPTRTARRRRLPTDESAVATPRQARPRSPRQGPRYALTLDTDSPSLISDWFPTSSLGIAGWLLGGLLVCWLSGLGHVQRPWIEAHSRTELTWLDVTRADSIGGWWGSVTLLLCAGWAVGVFQLRGYRVDDYRGHYRVWAWLSAVSVLASLDSLAGIHRTCGLVATRVLPWPVSAPWLGWPVVAALAGLPIAWWLFREMRSSIAARIWLGVAGLCYAGAAWPEISRAAAHAGLPRWAEALLVMLAPLGHWFLWGACACYARRVRREIEGATAADTNRSADAATDAAPALAIAAPPAESARKRRWWHGWSLFGRRRAAESQEEDELPSTVKIGSRGSGPDRARGTAEHDVRRSNVARPANREPDDCDQADRDQDDQDDQDDRDEADHDDRDRDDGLQHLSKAERRKLRRQKRKVRQAA